MLRRRSISCRAGGRATRTFGERLPVPASTSAVMPCGLSFCLSGAPRCGPVHPTSPLSFCQLCSVSQCARRCCAPHRCWGVTSPVLRKCWSVRWSAERVSARLRIALDQPSPSARPGSRGVRGSCAARPLRPPASLLHKAAFCKVLASRSAKAPLDVAHRFAPSRVSQTGLMQSGLRWRAGASAVGAPRSHLRPTRRRLCALVVVVAPGHWSGAARFVLVSGLRPVMWCMPRPTLVPRRCAALTLRDGLPVRPPRGLPYPTRPCHWFCYKLGSCLRNEYEGYRPKRPVIEPNRWLQFVCAAATRTSSINALANSLTSGGMARCVPSPRMICPCRGLSTCP